MYSSMVRVKRSIDNWRVICFVEPITMENWNSESGSWLTFEIVLAVWSLGGSADDAGFVKMHISVDSELPNT